MKRIFIGGCNSCTAKSNPDITGIFTSARRRSIGRPGCREISKASVPLLAGSTLWPGAFSNWYRIVRLARLSSTCEMVNRCIISPATCCKEGYQIMCSGSVRSRGHPISSFPVCLVGCHPDGLGQRGPSFFPRILNGQRPQPPVWRDVAPKSKLPTKIFFTQISLSVLTFEGGLFQAEEIVGPVWRGGQTHLEYSSFPENS